METQKKRRGDRKDGRLMRELDSLHYVTGILYPNRCDNEAYISQRIDLTNMNAYIAKKNETETEFPYTMFHLVLAALAFLHCKDEYTLSDIHDYLRRQVTECRSDKVDPSTGAMDILIRIPLFVSKAAIHLLMWLDKHGWVPADIIATDPYYSSVVISNLGSIKLKCGYHHLTNWGTCSLFCIIGEKAVRPIYAPDGTMTMKETLDLGLTIDERLADGYYYSKSVRLLKHLLEHPEELEKPMKEEVIYE